MKVWWNYDQDFKVLNATIAHMFQGTPRQRYLMRDNLYRDQCHVQPTFKIASRYYRGQRPPNLTFSSVPIPCRLHPQEVDELGLACFCRLGNVDLSTILDRTCGILNLQSGLQPLYNARNPTGEDPRPWFRPKHANGYHALLTNVLRKDRLYPILDYFKDVPRNSPQGQQGRQDTFYETLKPGMEVDNNLMGYNIGDVVGVAIIMRYLTTTDDRKL